MTWSPTQVHGRVLAKAVAMFATIFLALAVTEAARFQQLQVFFPQALVVAPSTWDTFQDADAQSFDVILLQEHGMKGSELHALIRFASSSGSCSFAAEPQERRNEAPTSPGRAFLFTKRFSEPGSWPVLEPQILARFWNMGAEPRTP